MSCATSQSGGEQDGKGQHPLWECQHPHWGRRLLQIGLVILFLDLMAVFFWEGLGLRRFAWDFTTAARFTSDITRNYSAGRESRQNGWLNLYENQITEKRTGDNRLNYTPLRLAVFHAWAAWNAAHVAKPEAWQAPYEFNAFLMRFNTLIEFMTALAAWLLVYHWVQRTWLPKGGVLPLGPRPRPGPWTGVVRASLAFLLVWLSPAMIVMGHGWPSPNVWLPCWFLWTVLFCSWEKWFIAGLVTGVGAMFQGQLLFVAPIFVLWPLFAGQPGRALRWLSGFGLSFMLIASGWMLTRRPDMTQPLREWNGQAILWLLGSVVLVLLVALRPRRVALSDAELAGLEAGEASACCPRLRCCVRSMRSGWRRYFGLAAGQNRWKHPLSWVAMAAGVLAVVVMVRPVFAGGFSGSACRYAVAAAVVIVMLAWWRGWRFNRYLLPGLVGAGLLLCIPLFGASTAWWDLGFMYGTERHPYMVVGPANNLCALLEQFGWTNTKEIVQTIPAGAVLGFPKAAYDVTMTMQMFWIYCAMLVGTCVAIALQWRRKDRNFLIAIATPWILFYTIPCQIHERYLLFAAAAGACVIGCSVGMMLLDIFFILLTYIQTSHCMMISNRIGPGSLDLDNPLFNAEMAGYFQRLRPDISYAVVLACIIFFYVSFTRYRRIIKVKRVQQPATVSPDQKAAVAQDPGAAGAAAATSPAT